MTKATLKDVCTCLNNHGINYATPQLLLLGIQGNAPSSELLFKTLLDLLLDLHKIHVEQRPVFYRHGYALADLVYFAVFDLNSIGFPFSLSKSFKNLDSYTLLSPKTITATILYIIAASEEFKILLIKNEDFADCLETNRAMKS